MLTIDMKAEAARKQELANHLAISVFNTNTWDWQDA